MVALKSSLMTPLGMTFSQSPDGDTIFPLSRGPSTHPLGTFTTLRFASTICGASVAKLSVIRYSICREVLGPPACAENAARPMIATATATPVEIDVMAKIGHKSARRMAPSQSGYDTRFCEI